MHGLHLATQIDEPAGGTVGRTASRARPSFRQLIAPWVELQALEAEEAFHDDFRIGKGDREGSSLPDGEGDPVAWGRMLIDVAETYKSNCMVFHYVANAILSAFRVHETRPLTEYRSSEGLSGRVPALRAIARALFDEYDTLENDDAVRFRSPLEVLVGTCYSNSRLTSMLAQDEMAVLFSLLAQSVGIPSWFVVDTDSRELTVECDCGSIPGRRGSSNTIGVFSPRQRRLDFMPARVEAPARIEFHGREEKTTGGSRRSVTGGYLLEPGRSGHFPTVLEGLVGTSDTGASRFWKAPQGAPSWYPALHQAYRQFDISLHRPFLIKPVLAMNQTVVARNYGPPVTGALIAYMVRIYTANFGRLFRRIVVDELAKKGLRYSNLSPLELANEIAIWVKDNFAYREEDHRVEAILSPLLRLRMHCFYPKVLRGDCDDLSVLTMTLQESCGIATAVRLAGDPIKPGTKPHEIHQYHVYPLAVIDGRAHVFDVSGFDLYAEMPHGGNKVDFAPRDPGTFEGVFTQSRINARQLAATGGYLRIVGAGRISSL